jgi:uncharacterized protein
MKLLFWIALFVLVYWALRDKNRKQHRAASQGVAGRHDAARDAARPAAAEPMLQCRQCGVHFPASEAMRNAVGDAFCSEEHRRVFGLEHGTR